MSAPENSIPVEVLDAAINAWFGTVPESKDQQEFFRNRMRAALAAAGYPIAPADGDAQTAAVRHVLAERRHQVEIGYNAEHDDTHVNDEIAALACYYLMPPGARAWPATETGYGDTLGKAIIPHGWHADDRQSRRHQLVMGTAMGLAEIERLDRAAIAAQQGKGGN